MPIPQYTSSVNPQYVTNIAPANPGQINNYTGEALSQAGGALSGIGGQAYSAAVDQENQQDRLNAQIWASNAYSQAVMDWNQDLINRKNNLTGPGTGFAKTFNSDFNDYQSELLNNTPNQQTKQYLEEQLNGLNTRLTTDAQDFQNKTFVDYNVNQIQNTIDNSAKASAASQGATAENSINNLTQVINQLPVEQSYKFKLLDSSHDQMFNSTIDTMIMNNPQQAQNYIYPALGKYPQGSVNSQIESAAQQNNVSPLIAMALMGSESGMSSTAQNPNSTAKGLLQFTDATWKDYGGTPENRNDPNTQIQLGMKYIADQQNSLQAILGHPPSPAELKAGIMFRGNAAAIIQANPDTPISNIIGDNTAALNNMTGKTTGQVMQSFTNLMDAQTKKFAATDNYLVQTATSPQLFSAANKIKEALNKQIAAQKFGFEQTVNNQISMANNGQYNQIQNPLNPQTFSMYYSDPNEALAKYNDYANQLQVGNYKSQLVNMTPAQAQATYESLTPVANSYDYADKIKLQKQFQQARIELNTAMQNDGVGYLNNADPYIKSLNQQLQASPNDPILKGQYYSTLIADQQRQGVQNIKILSKDDENQLISKFNNSNGQQRADVITQQANNLGPSFWPYLAQQLQKNTSAPEGIASIISAPTDNAKDTAAVLSTQNLKDIEKSLPSDTNIKDFNNSIQQVFTPYEQSLSINETGSKSVQDVRNTITKLAMNNRIAGMTNANATQSAYDMYLGKDKYNYVTNNLANTTIRVPKNIDSTMVANSTKQIVNNLTLNDLDTSNAVLLQNPYSLDMKKNADGYIDNIKSNSRWITTSDDQGAELWFRGYNNVDYPVIGKNKQQITKSWSELNSISNSITPINNPEVYIHPYAG